MSGTGGVTPLLDRADLEEIQRDLRSRRSVAGGVAANPPVAEEPRRSKRRRIQVPADNVDVGQTASLGGSWVRSLYPLDTDGLVEEAFSEDRLSQVSETTDGAEEDEIDVDIDLEEVPSVERQEAEAGEIAVVGAADEPLEAPKGIQGASAKDESAKQGDAAPPLPLSAFTGEADGSAASLEPASPPPVPSAQLAADPEPVVEQLDGSASEPLFESEDSTVVDEPMPGLPGEEDVEAGAASHPEGVASEELPGSRDAGAALPPVPQQDEPEVTPPPVPQQAEAEVTPPPVPQQAEAEPEAAAAPPPVPQQAEPEAAAPPPVPVPDPQDASAAAGSAPPPVPADVGKEAGQSAPPPVPQKSQDAAAATPPSAPADQTKRSRPKKFKKPWFEDFFDDDYLRTIPFMTPTYTRKEMEYIRRHLDLPDGASLLDVGCGYGRLAIEFAREGFDVTGLDTSLPLMFLAVEAATAAKVEVNFVHRDMREMSFDREFDGVYCVMTSFGYFDDETNRDVVGRMFRALKPGGKLFVEVINRDFILNDLPSRVWWEGDDCVVMDEVEFNFLTSRIVSKRSVVFSDGRSVNHDLSIRAYCLHELGRLLHNAGFRVLSVTGNINTDNRFFGQHSPYLIVVSQKPQ